MLFYKVVGTLADEKRADKKDDRRTSQDRRRGIGRRCEEYNRTHSDDSYFFVSDIMNEEVTVGIINFGMRDKTKQTRAFFKSIELNVKNFDIDEITFSSMRSLLSSADCS